MQQVLYRADRIVLLGASKLVFGAAGITELPGRIACIEAESSV